MPTNLTRGNTAQFVAEFVNAAGTLVNPSSASITITYNISGVATSTTSDLTLSGSFWIGTWDSTPADLGNADWSVSSSVTTNPAQTGTIRVIDP